jgi:hypothetical protein
MAYSAKMWIKCMSVVLVLAMLLFTIHSGTSTHAQGTGGGDGAPTAVNNAKFAGPLLFDQLSSAELSKSTLAARSPASGTAKHRRDDVICDRWAVVMTSIAPTEAV